MPHSLDLARPTSHVRHGCCCRSGLVAMSLAGLWKKSRRRFSPNCPSERPATRARKGGLISERISNLNLPPTDQPERARLRDMLIRHEGRQTHSYRDIFGKITIGIGRNLSDRGLVADEIDLLFANDVAIASAICGDLYGVTFSAATSARQMTMISLAFNLDGPRLASFRWMRAAIHHDNWMQAASKARHSRCAKQVGWRSTEIAGILASGVTTNV